MSEAKLRTLACVLIATWLPGAAFAEQLAPAQQIAAEIQAGKHEGFDSFIMRVDDQIVARTVVGAYKSNRPPDLRSATRPLPEARERDK